MNELLVEGIVRSAASTLAESLHVYWPTAGANELAERNSSLHIAGALQRGGFHVFGEGNSENDSSARLDVIAVHPAQQTAVIVECKRLIKGASADDMAADVARIQAFHFNQGSDFKHRGLQIAHTFGVLVATTWREDHAKWFLAGGDHAALGDSFGRLAAAVPKGATWGASVLQHFKRSEGDRAGEFAMQWLVYVVFKR